MSIPILHIFQVFYGCRSFYYCWCALTTSGHYDRIPSFSPVKTRWTRIYRKSILVRNRSMMVFVYRCGIPQNIWAVILFDTWKTACRMNERDIVLIEYTRYSTVRKRLYCCSITIDIWYDTSYERYYKRDGWMECSSGLCCFRLHTFVTDFFLSVPQWFLVDTIVYTWI